MFGNIRFRGNETYRVGTRAGRRLGSRHRRVQRIRRDSRVRTRTHTHYRRRNQRSVTRLFRVTVTSRLFIRLYVRSLNRGVHSRRAVYGNLSTSARYYRRGGSTRPFIRGLAFRMGVTTTRHLNYVRIYHSSQPTRVPRARRPRRRRAKRPLLNRSRTRRQFNARHDTRRRQHGGVNANLSKTTNRILSLHAIVLR